MKSFLKTFLIFLFIFLCLTYPNGKIFSKEISSERNQSLKVGIAYLNLRKSFLDFPIVWKTNMPIASVDYEMSTKRFSYRISIDYGRSTYIKINDSKRWGKNSFSILAFNYDFIWHKQRHCENPKFFWGFGVSLENLEIAQKLEIIPGKYNEYKDQYLGIGPALSLFWRLKKAQFGVRFGSSTSIPYASVGTMHSDVAFTDKAYISWVKIRTDLYYQYKVLKSYNLLIEFKREALAYGRSHTMTYSSENLYPYGSFLFKSLQMSLRYYF